MKRIIIILFVSVTSVYAVNINLDLSGPSIAYYEFGNQFTDTSVGSTIPMNVSVSFESPSCSLI